jgi:hypothetical protein
MQPFLRSHQPLKGAVLERIAAARDEWLLEDEPDPELARPALCADCADRHGKKRRSRNSR